MFIFVMWDYISFYIFASDVVHLESSDGRELMRFNLSCEGGMWEGYVAASEWMMIRFIRRINPGRSFEEWWRLRFEEPYKNLKCRFMITRMRSRDSLSSHDHVVQSWC